MNSAAARKTSNRSSVARRRLSALVGLAAAACIRLDYEVLTVSDSTGGQRAVGGSGWASAGVRNSGQGGIGDGGVNASGTGQTSGGATDGGAATDGGVRPLIGGAPGMNSDTNVPAGTANMPGGAGATATTATGVTLGGTVNSGGSAGSVGTLLPFGGRVGTGGALAASGAAGGSNGVEHGAGMPGAGGATTGGTATGNTTPGGATTGGTTTTESGTGGTTGGSAGSTGNCVPDSNCGCATNLGRIYRLCAIATPFGTAEQACIQQGMQLVRVDSPDENAWLLQQFTNFNLFTVTVAVFLGGTDSAVEGEWRWLDGTIFWNGAPVNGLYSNWEKSPSGQLSDYLVMLNDGTWSDRAAGARDCSYACESL